MKQNLFLHGWLVGCRLKANCLLMEPGRIGGMPSVGDFLWDPNPYLHKFWRKHGKVRTARSTGASGIEPAIFRLPVLSAEPFGHW